MLRSRSLTYGIPKLTKLSNRNILSKFITDAPCTGNLQSMVKMWCRCMHAYGQHQWECIASIIKSIHCQMRMHCQHYRMQTHCQMRMHCQHFSNAHAWLTDSNSCKWLITCRRGMINFAKVWWVMVAKSSSAIMKYRTQTPAPLPIYNAPLLDWEAWRHGLALLLWPN
jgi:hypothetical protein